MPRATLAAGILRAPAGFRLKALKPGVVRRFRFADEADQYPTVGYEIRGMRVYRVMRDGSEEWVPGLAIHSILERLALGNLREVSTWEVGS